MIEDHEVNSDIDIGDVIREFRIINNTLEVKTKSENGLPTLIKIKAFLLIALDN